MPSNYDKRLTIALARHRGPFTFRLCRVIGSLWSTENCTNIVDGTPAEVIEEARALVNDPRDTIWSVSIWSNREECYVLTVMREATNE